MKPLTQSRLIELLTYDLASGCFTWRVSRGGRAHAGGRAGTVHPDGYVFITIDGVSHAAHRLAFLYMLGQFPVEQVDHVNHDGTNNRWTNLRPATRSQNCVNRHRSNSVGDGFRGVLKVGNRYQAAICVRENGKKRRIHLGMFATAEDAHQAYLVAAAARHGEFLPTTLNWN